MRAYKLITKLSVALTLGLAVTPAHADVGSIANSVLQELTALVAPAIGLGVVWLGFLIMTGRGTLITFLTFVVGAVILLSGGFF
ncbi:TrbC/VirB2 family protein [Rhizorhapis suberifaciens]|uniref:Type IV secretory pathway VirB2 component (Pilin) n=1 Tax=Rhizorhapis suberifaciens TaxID=13656 RepID=A0A840HZC8_9SPHN|nr:TrbC/VirB2 family protein [Rhizorhapis suberifaciens]MBB4642766.1 type IV secretory pathway VirB2 component (pilin) [Rhizorhapis suberifaciens]